MPPTLALTAILAVAVASAIAQDQSASLKPTPATGPTLVVSCDRACLWMLDGKPMGSLGEGDSKTVTVSLGQHRVQAEAQEGLYIDEKKIDLDDATETDVRLRLKEPPAGAERRLKETPAGAESCVQIAEVSAKVPALPAGSPCAKHLYTVSNANLDYVSPLEGPALRTIFGWKSSPDSYSLDYVETRVGTGPLVVPEKWITVHYTGYLIDGTKFDSSLDRGEPLTFRYGEGQVIKGWDTGFAGMRVGGKRRLFIPSQLAYGAARKGPIPANAELIFDVEFISQSDEASQANPMRAPE